MSLDTIEDPWQVLGILELYILTLDRPDSFSPIMKKIDFSSRDEQLTSYLANTM